MKTPLLSKLVGLLTGKNTAPTALWQPAQRAYPLLATFDPAAEDLFGKQGLYALWHLGVRPQWLRVGMSDDLGATLTALSQASWVSAHENNRGVFAAWAPVTPERGDGRARFLSETLKPAFQGEPAAAERAHDLAVAPVACPLPPGTQS